MSYFTCKKISIPSLHWPSWTCVHSAKNVFISPTNKVKYQQDRKQFLPKNYNDDDDDLLEANIQITLQDPRLILGVKVHCFPSTSSHHLLLIDALLKSCDALVFLLRLFTQQTNSLHDFQKKKK